MLSSKKNDKDLASEQQLIIEERVVKSDGDVSIKKYAKGRFLGKVKKSNHV